jgi:hypothetical protein
MLARALYLRLHRGRRGADRAQPDAEPDEAESCGAGGPLRRLSGGLVELPKQPKTASFFTVLGQESKQAPSDATRFPAVAEAVATERRRLVRLTPRHRRRVAVVNW